MARSSLDAASGCRAKVDSIFGEAHNDANYVGGDVRLEEVNDEVHSFVFDKSAVQRAKAALTSFQAAGESVAVNCGFDGSTAGDSTTKKALKQRAKRRRNRTDAMMTKVMGSNINEARANAKAISLDELLSLEALLALPDRRPMQPSRRRRRLAWALWLHRPGNAEAAAADSA